jgi:hypothetical protein
MSRVVHCKVSNVHLKLSCNCSGGIAEAAKIKP